MSDDNKDSRNCGSDEKANASWGGRFSHGPAELARIFTDSQHYDRVLFEQDILASMAHARMLGRQGIVTAAEAAMLVDGLEQVRQEILAGKFVWRKELEDVHMNIEARLTELIGETGKKLHTGRSRNDQVGLTFRLYVADCCEHWLQLLHRLVTVIADRADANRQTILPGFTHLQPAQPVSLAQHLLAYAGMFQRDSERLHDALRRTKTSPLGAAALAGSTFPLDPHGVARDVGFESVYANSMDAVSDRDFVLESLFIASTIMMHISRLSEEIVIWSSPAFGFIHLPDHFSTGSSIMPQKKNPDVAELLRGKAGRVYGDLMSMLTVMKGLPLAYNRDLQEDKECFFDADSTVSISLRVIAEMLSELDFDPHKMRKACGTGFLNATELADYLAAKGLPFREAHHVTGRIVALAESGNVPLEDLDLAAMQAVCDLIDADVHAVLDYDACVQRRETYGGTGPKSVDLQLRNLRAWLDSHLARAAS